MAVATVKLFTTKTWVSAAPGNCSVSSPNTAARFDLYIGTVAPTETSPFHSIVLRTMTTFGYETPVWMRINAYESINKEALTVTK